MTGGAGGGHQVAVNAPNAETRSPLPSLGDILPSLPPTLKARLLAAVDLAILWNKSGGQATVTERTLAALTAITPAKTATVTPIRTTLDLRDEPVWWWCRWRS